MAVAGYDINSYSPVKMMALPVAVFLVALAIVGFTWIETGMPVTPGIDFAGGTAVTVYTTDDIGTIEAVFAGFPLLSVTEGISGGTFIKFGPMDDLKFEELSGILSERYANSKIDHIGETFGQTLQHQAAIALIFSFIGMAIVVFIAFRTFVPSVAVIVSAFSDIIIAAACMNIAGVPLTLGTTAALLMLIGYSVDSDILLTTRILKRKGKLDEKLSGAFRTGFIMTTTTISAIAAMLVVSYIGGIEVITQISIVLLFGLIIDLMNTWMLNAGVLKMYVQRGEGK
jgi:preprotein translocase subunit SecF